MWEAVRVRFVRDCWLVAEPPCLLQREPWMKKVFLFFLLLSSWSALSSLE